MGTTCGDTRLHLYWTNYNTETPDTTRRLLEYIDFTYFQVYHKSFVITPFNHNPFVRSLLYQHNNIDLFSFYFFFFFLFRPSIFLFLFLYKLENLISLITLISYFIRNFP